MRFKVKLFSFGDNKIDCIIPWKCIKNRDSHATEKLNEYKCYFTFVSGTHTLPNDIFSKTIVYDIILFVLLLSERKDNVYRNTNKKIFFLKNYDIYEREYYKNELSVKEKK